LKKANVACDVDVVRDGAELLDYLFGTGAYRGDNASHPPNVILLDLKMPKLDGLQVLQVLRRAHRSDSETIPPVVVLTSSDREEDVHESYRLGAHGYVCKPIDFSMYIETVQRLVTYWLHVNRPPSNIVNLRSRFVAPSQDCRG
jgi:two-component system response regulator